MKSQEATTTTAKKTAKAKSKATKGAAKPAATEAPAKAGKSTKTTKAAKATPKAKDAARAGSKTAIILDLLRRKEGASIAEIAKATNWLNHSIRGFISGHVTKKMGLKVESTKSESGERTYRILA